MFGLYPAPTVAELSPHGAGRLWGAALQSAELAGQRKGSPTKAARVPIPSIMKAM